MLLLPGILRMEVEARTGASLQIEEVYCNPFGFELKARQFTVGNSADFEGGGSMLEVESLSVSGSLPALLRDEWQLDRLELRLDKALLVRDERGQLNVEAFLDQLLGSKVVRGETPFRVRQAQLYIGELEILDLTQPVAARSRLSPKLELDLKDLDSPSALFAPLVELSQRVGALSTAPSSP